MAASDEIVPLIMLSREEWQGWLELNQASVPFAWLAMSKKASTIQTLSYADAVEEAICFGWIDGKMKPYDHEIFVVRFSPRKPRSVWSKKNRDRAEAMIREGKMKPRGMAIIEAAKKNGQWDKYYDFTKEPVIPEDLRMALEEVPGAMLNFITFSIRIQNAYIWVIEKAKRPETRRKKLNEVVRRSKLNLKPGI